MIIITISLKIITISIFFVFYPARTRHFEQVSAAAITAKIMEKNMSGCEKRNAIGCEKEKLGGVSGEQFVRDARLCCRPHCAGDFLPPAVRGYVAARGARKIAWKDVTRRAKKYKAHDPELAAVRDVS